MTNIIDFETKKAVSEPTPVLKVHPEFVKFFPALEEKYFKGLEKDILENGCKDPIVLWNGFIIDGHHRYKICQKHQISFRVRYEELEDEDDVKLWMIRTQAYRRNLSTELLLHYEMVGLEIEKKQAKKRQGIRNDQWEHIKDKDHIKNIRSKSTGSCEGKALEQVAKNAGVGYEKAYQYKHILDAGREKEVLEDGRSINKVFKDLRKEGKTPSGVSPSGYSILSILFKGYPRLLAYPRNGPLFQLLA